MGEARPATHAAAKASAQTERMCCACLLAGREKGRSGLGGVVCRKENFMQLHDEGGLGCKAGVGKKVRAGETKVAAR
jgi:hypothetical protein